MGGLLETSKHAGVVYSVMLNRGWMDISVKNLSAIILTDLYGCSDKTEYCIFDYSNLDENGCRNEYS
ncbi:unnamed protein product [Dracunculus medinensis]|uniref:Pentatricopeptide repeat-containing protein n=1 Tax=Dracunculus medinensis TaxID=318479 RepID=A0A0N4UI16_DRAME|nr:unnamed protein product [Dracunculus medinensis]